MDKDPSDNSVLLKMPSQPSVPPDKKSSEEPIPPDKKPPEEPIPPDKEPTKDSMPLEDVTIQEAPQKPQKKRGEMGKISSNLGNHWLLNEKS